jgi:ABC-type transport system involved in multi-copper enzyme maturation permease subunit
LHVSGRPGIVVNDNTFFMVMMTFGGLMGLLTLVYVIRGALGRQSGESGGWEVRGAARRINAVARATLSEGLRARLASGFLGVIFVAIPLFWMTAVGDGTIKGRVQMFITYSMGLTAFVLALLTIFFACRSLSVEIASRQIYGIVSKPIPRWQIIAGKWAGVMSLNVMVVAAATAGTYFGTRAIVANFKSSLVNDLQIYAALPINQAEAAVASLDHVTGVGRKGIESPVIDAMASVLGQSKEQITDMLLKLPEMTRVNLRRFDELRRQVLVARACVYPEVPNLDADVEREYKVLEEEGRLPDDWSRQKVMERIRVNLNAQFCAIAPGNARQWRLKGPPPEKGRDFVMSVRFKMRAPGQLLAATFDGTTLEGDTLLSRWGFGDPRKANFIEMFDAFPVNTFHELEVPGSSLENDGTVILNYMNIDPRAVPAVFDLPNKDLQLLYRVGSFELNLFQTALAILIPLTCLAAFGVCASTFLSFPVGSLIVVTLFIISSSMSFIAESLALTEDYAPPVRNLAFELRKATVDSIDWALRIGDCDPVRLLSEGRSIGWDTIWINGGKYALVKGLIVLGVAVMVFRRRELAAVTV